MAERQTDQTGERTEKATPLRMEEARKRGQVPRSADLTSAAAALAALLVLALGGPGLLREMTAMTAAMLDDRGKALDPARDEIGQDVSRAAGGAIARSGGIMAAIAGLIAVAAFVQVGPLWATDRIAADWDRVSMSAGWKRLMSSRTLVRAVFAVAKVAAAGAVAWWSAQGMVARLAASGRLDAASFAGEAGNLAATLILRVGLCLLLLGLAEYLYQRLQHGRDLRMTRREWLDDMKRAEGDPATRRRRGQLGRQVTIRRRARSEDDHRGTEAQR
jgi:flagellar biosynthetic protein FlhB